MQSNLGFFNARLTGDLHERGVSLFLGSGNRLNGMYALCYPEHLG